MKYNYQDLSHKQFEDLIITLCQHLLGIATQEFSEGPDGGRDAKFIGKAEYYPSKNDPWNGTVIIQAKHTNGYNHTFSEKDFYSKGSINTVIGKEIPRIKKLQKSGELDYYMLFANRRLSANTATNICKEIATQCGIPEKSIHLCGTEQLERYLRRFKSVADEVGLDPVDTPLLVSPDALSEIIEALVNLKFCFIPQDFSPTTRVSYEDKNKFNNMTADYAKELRNRYLKDTKEIRSFLTDPNNKNLLEKYEAAIEEFQFQIITHRKDYQTFDLIMEYLKNLLLGRDAILRANPRLTRSVLFYMYWNCDIGTKE